MIEQDSKRLVFMIERDNIRLVYDSTGQYTPGYDWTGQYTPGLWLNWTVYAWFMIEKDSLRLVYH